LTLPIAADGSFLFDDTFQSTLTVDQEKIPLSEHVTIHGKFDGTSASGDLNETDTFTYQGEGFSCTSGPVTWTASKSP